MFCRKCGTEIEEGTIFCSNCGENINRIHTSTESISQDSKTINIGYCNDNMINFMSSIIAIIKNFIVKGSRYVIDEYTSKKGLEWSVLVVFSILSCGLGLTINITQLLGNDISSYLSYAGLNFGTMFGLNVLTSFVAIFTTITVMWLLFNYVAKVNIGYTTVANIYSITFLPVSIVYIVNMLVGCIYAPLSLMFLVVVIIYAFTLLHYSIEKMAPRKKTDAMYLITVFITVLLTCITWFVSYKETIFDIVSSIF